MAEFQAMFVMYMKSVSIGYGSPLWAFVITRCSMPWAASGASQENALSIRRGVPSVSTRRSSGPVGKPSGGPGNGRPGTTSPAFPAGLGPVGIGLGYGGLYRKPPGTSIVPSRICSRCRARQVWKPLACAEMPRMACMLTGRPIVCECRRPQTSVQGTSTAIACSNAVCASSAAIRRMVAAGMPVLRATASGLYWSAR